MFNKTINNVTNNYEIDYDKLAEAIVQAQKKADEEAKLKEERNRLEWRKSINIKEHSENEGVLKKTILSVRNAIVGTINILFLSRKKAKYDFGTYALLQTVTHGIFCTIKWALYLLSMIIVLNGFFKIIEGTLSITTFLFAIGLWLIARILRIVCLEIDQLKDRGYLLGILSSVVGFITLIATVITLFITTIRG